MLKKLLIFKKSLYHKSYNDGFSFIILIDDAFESFDDVDIKTFSKDPHWKNYLLAILVSFYMEKNGYSLNSWNQCVENNNYLKNKFGFSFDKNEGNIFEFLILHSINQVFHFGENSLRIKAFRATNDSSPFFLTDDSNDPLVIGESDNSRIINNLKVEMKVRGKESKKIWGDNDIIVLMEHDDVLQQFCIISCKTSLRERVYQSVFWSMRSRLEGIGKHVFVTLDKGVKGASEIGSRDLSNKAKKSRDVLESTMDRVYVFRDETEVNRSQTIKGFLHLREDLIQWSREIAGI